MNETHLTQVTAGKPSDIYYVDVELFDTTEYGSVYLLDSDEPAVVDTGTGRNYEMILDGLAELNITPQELSAIVLTHVHLDHAGGASPLVAACPNADVYVHESGARFLRDPSPLWKGTKAVMGGRISYYRKPDPIPDERIVELTDGDTVDLGNRQLDVHYAPGHAFHQVVYYDPASDGIFAADAAGVYVPSRGQVRHTSPPPGFELEGCLADIDMLESLDPTALYYGHFGDQPTGDRLSEYRDVLTSWVERIAAKREQLQDDEAVIEYFIEQAETTDSWGETHASGEERVNVQGVFHYLDEREDSNEADSR